MNLRGGEFTVSPSSATTHLQDNRSHWESQFLCIFNKLPRRSLSTANTTSSPLHHTLNPLGIKEAFHGRPNAECFYNTILVFFKRHAGNSLLATEFAVEQRQGMVGPQTGKL